jgi:hypothetical protein
VIAAGNHPQRGIGDRLAEAVWNFNGKERIPITVHHEGTSRNRRQVLCGKIHIIVVLV